MQDKKHGKQQQNQLKQKIFDYVAELVSNEISIKIYVLLLVIDNLQYIAYYNNGVIFYNSLPFAVFSMFADYINLLKFLKKYNINQILVPIFFVFNALHVLLLILGYRSYQRKMQKLNKTVSERNYHKNKVEYFANFIIMLQTTILTIPMFQCSLTAFYCSSENPFSNKQNCYVGSHIIIAAIGFMNLIWLLFVNFFVAVYYYNRNPFSTSFSTCSSNWYNLGRFIVKIAPMLYMMYDPTISFPILFLIVMNISYPAYLLVFSKFLFKYYRYNFKLQKIVVGIQTVTCFTNTGFILVQLLQNKDKKPNILLLFWCAAAIALSLAVAELTGVMKRSLISQINSTEKKSLPKILQYMIFLIYQIEQSQTVNKQGFFVANIARTHQLKCQDLSCYCVKFMEQRRNVGYNKNKAVFYTLLLAVIDRIIKENKKAYPFFILKAYILYYKLQSQIKAATTITIIMSDKLDFSDEMLTKGLLFELNQQYNDTRDMQIYRKFNEFVLQQQEQSLIVIDLYLSYWEELLDQNTSILKLKRILKQIKKQKAKMQTIVDGALGIFNNHVRVLFMYKTFLKEVINDLAGSIRCEERYKIGLKQSKLSNVDTVNKIQFRPNQNLLVINFTRNYLTHSDILGSYKIVSISSNIREFLGYSNTQLKNSSINKLIPRIYHKYHDNFIDTALQKRDADILSYQLRVFPLNSSGNIIQCNLMSKFMPNISYGINIVSFLEQCDVEKDQYYLIYDSKTGIVDSMSKQAQNILKENTKRKNNDIFTATNDFIGDLLPHWDYKKQIWRDTLKNKKSIKSEVFLSDEKIDVKQIEIVRSDGLKDKDIKILKFKGSFFSKMFSLSNESQRLQKYLNVFNPKNIFSNLNTGQIEQILPPKSQQIIDRDKQRKKSANEMIKILKGQVLPIQALPPKFSRILFIFIQSFIFCLAIGLTTFQFIRTNMTLTNYSEDTELIFNINVLQSFQSDMTYIISLTSVNEAYTNSTMVLPYQSYASQISPEDELTKMDQIIQQVLESVALVNRLLITKVEKKQITDQQLIINAKYLKTAGTKHYFTKSMTIVQAIYQYISYCRQLINDMHVLHKTITDVLFSPYYFFIFKNSLDNLPNTMMNIKRSILNSINTLVSGSFNTFWIVKLFVTALIICSLVSIILYYNYIYKNFITKVLSMYEQIPLEKIKNYEQKCRKYKFSFNQKAQKQPQQPVVVSSGSVMNINSSVLIDRRDSHLPNQDDQNHELLKSQKHNSSEEVQVQYFIIFESKPQLKSIICSKIIWILIYGILLFILCYSYYNASQNLKKDIMTLNNYTLAQNSMIQIRLYSHLSMNMLNYWQQSYLSIIDQELKKDFLLLIQLLNDTSLNFTAYKPYISAKYVQLKLVQYYKSIDDTDKIKQLTQTIEDTLEDMDLMIRYLLGQCENYLRAMRGETQIIATYLNIYISFSLVYILIYWIVGVRYFYKKLLDKHQLAYQMHNIIGFNLKKQIEPIA